MHAEARHQVWASALEMLEAGDPSAIDDALLGLKVTREQLVRIRSKPANDDRGAFQSLRDELDVLARRQDWTATAAACLVPDRPHPAKRAGASSTNPLAAPLPCNGSQESALDRFRREPLTIVTGPPGTGKTQLVVNAVTNTWLDGETVLVASTNNGAVNVAAVPPVVGVTAPSVSRLVIARLLRAACCGKSNGGP